MTRSWWLSSEKLTIVVRTFDGKIVEAPPIARKFIGQPTQNLGRWMRAQGGFRVEPLP